MPENNAPENLGALQVEARVQDLQLGYGVDRRDIKYLLTETGQQSFPPAENFDPGAYLQLEVVINGPKGPRLGEIKTPLQTEDPNVRYRLYKEKSVLSELQNPSDPAVRDSELLQHFVFPEFISEKTFIDKTYGPVPISIMYGYQETKPAGSVHLVTPGILKVEDMSHFARLIGYLQRIGDNDRFAYNPLYVHRFMSFGPDDGNWTDDKPLFKWTRDLRDRDPLYRSLLKERGNEFADGLQRLVDPDDLKILFTGKKVLAFGNLIWCNWGVVQDGVFRLKTTERTAGVQTLESDNVTVLSGLVADPPLFNEFFVRSLEQNPTHLRLEHRRRGFVLDRWSNVLALQKAYEQGAKDLKGPIEFFTQQAFDALHKENLWDASRYPFLTDEPLPLKY